MTKEEIKKYLEACGLSKTNIETILSNEEYIKLLESNIEIPNQVFTCLIGITNSSKNTYIRLIVN